MTRAGPECQSIFATASTEFEGRGRVCIGIVRVEGVGDSLYLCVCVCVYVCQCIHVSVYNFVCYCANCYIPLLVRYHRVLCGVFTCICHIITARLCVYMGGSCSAIAHRR